MLRPIVFGVLTVIPQLIHACSCVGIPGSCDRGWNLGETIFLGKTTAMEKISQPDSRAFLSSYAAHFTVEESFRGGEAPGSEIVVYTGAGGGDCGYPFVPGTSYLVYASSNNGRLSAGTCSETKPAVMAGGVLRELRAVRDHGPLDDVFGTIGMAPRGVRWEDLTESQPLAGVTVRVAGGAGSSLSTQTDERGVYAFRSLSPGKYRIEPDLPPGFARAAIPFTAEVNAGGAACRADNFARPDGRITGTVVDAAGKTRAGFVTVEPADPSERLAAQLRGGLPGDDIGPDGEFSLPRIPPGRYRLVFHPKTGRGVDFRATFYWPFNLGDAIDLAFGQHIEGVQFKAPLE